MEYLEDVLVPTLSPYRGDHSPPGSVLVLDNARHHWTDEAIAVLERTGCLLIFLPPYSPDLNPIEPAFGLLKGRMQRLRVTEFTDQLQGEIWRALTSLCDKNQAKGFFRKSGLSCITKREHELQKQNHIVAGWFIIMASVVTINVIKRINN